MKFMTRGREHTDPSGGDCEIGPRHQHVTARGARLHGLGRAAARSVPFWIVLATALCFAAATEATLFGVSTFSGVSGEIAFASNRDGNFEIYKMKADGSGVKRLTNSPTADFSPAWSPEGERIAWLSNQSLGSQSLGEVFVMSATGGGQKNLTKFTVPGSTPLKGGSPGWTPEGDKIGFFRDFAFTGGEFYTINADGSGLRRVRGDDGTVVVGSTPRWRPSGDKILFDGSSVEHVPGLFTINPNGSGLTDLTSGLGLKPFAGGGDWSPDGTQVVFAAAAAGSTKFDVYTMNYSGTGLSRLTNNQANDGAPVWSPDGTKIAFSSDRDGNREIYVMNANGSNQTNLTKSSANDSSPDWQTFNPPPSVSSLTVAPSSFKAGRNAVIQFNASETGETTIAVQRPTIGRKATIGIGKRQRTVCRTNTTRLLPKVKDRCTLWLPAVTSDQIAKEDVFEGVNNFLFNGKIGTKTLAPARYRIQIQVVDDLGKRGNTALANFTILAG